MTGVVVLSSADLKERLAGLERELEAAKVKLRAARRAAAAAHLGGGSADEVQSVRMHIQYLEDLVFGMRDLAARAEHCELTCEIDRRQKAHDNEAGRIEELRKAGTRGAANPGGSGSAFGAALRADREDRIAEFARYEQAHHAYLDEGKAIDSLVARRDKIRADSHDALRD